MKRFFHIILSLFTLTVLSGCNPIGSKTGNISIIYGITLALSLILLVGYCLFVQQKEIWFLLLSSSIFIVNIGYFSLSISHSIEEALLANRISYLGSVFLPMSMLMIILNVTKINYKKWLPMLLFLICIFVFLVAASPGYLDIYYKEVSLKTVHGVTLLNKVYGPWHSLYLYYLLTFFCSMIGFIVYAALRKNSAPFLHASMLAGAVFVNIGVWLIEQIVHIDFELLSVSYIICELFLLGLHLVMAEHENLKNTIRQQTDTEHAAAIQHTKRYKDAVSAATDSFPENVLSANPTLSVKEDVPIDQNSSKDLSNQKLPSLYTEEEQLIIKFYRNGLETLTKTEAIIFNDYISGKSTKEIMAELRITENTIKFHNKNIYSKLGVNSRKQMLELYKKSSDRFQTY